MFPITPMDWTKVALRGSTQVMALQLRLARAMVGMALDQQRKAIGLARVPLPGATGNICAPLRRPGHPRARPSAGLRSVPSCGNAGQTPPRPTTLAPVRDAEAQD
ncbi:hypothetical protein KO516_17150 [Citreicella sp. C3M06]|uniref:hypothetical protein n=1 Tax=Roseobacteraceae TaxID=2854170 RepID=UPI001C08E2ED|nr:MULTISPECIES: hypothetical protein [Roseobacteraceae]MBU2962517.1 hypothetical protein [Citreicella sp. C3M06]MDO6585431.1 hypothetical protein [Salipiger sp. 1_MG-2023]